MFTAEQLNDALAGRYAIEREIGAGGMATVFLARDLKHHRQVALKVLNPELGAVLGSERFMAEIEVTANLHHPNLLPLFDSGEVGGLLFYAMPYIEGETLRARLARERQLGVEEAIKITVAIAGALDYAHRHAVIHRDLKPENILMHEGQPLVMDFGIALAVSKAGGARITQTGLSLGTPQYMSPEQATGDHVLDARTDIYSLGAVLYEMLVGDPPHTGSTVQAVIAKVITERPGSVRATRPNVPEMVEAALMTALAKLPADRFATAADFSAALTGQRPVAMPTSSRMAAMADTTAGTMALPRSSRERLAWGVAVVALGLAAWSGSRRGSARPTEGTLGRFALALPDSVRFGGGPANAGRVAISRDGALVAFVGDNPGTFGARLYLRRADEPVAQPIRGSEGGAAPTFSPRGDWLLYVTGNALLKIPVGGGTPATLATSRGETRVIFAASWGDDDRILFNDGGDLWVTTADGREPRLLSARDSARAGLGLAFPSFLPGSRHALITITQRSRPDSARLGVIALADGSVTDLGVLGGRAHFVPPDRIVFSRTGGVVYAASFSLRKRQIVGDPVRLLDDVSSRSPTTPDIAVADNGWLVYRAGAASPTSALVVVDRAGREHRLREAEDNYTDPAVSPDGKRVAVGLHAGNFDVGDIWMYEMADGAWYRVTTDGASYRVAWSRDGKRILYLNGRSLDTRVLTRSWDGSGEATVLLTRPSLAEIVPGPAGGLSAIRTLSGPRDIYLAPTESLAAMRPFVVGPANEVNPEISPDGRWIAYQSDETGRSEVYTRPITAPGPRVAISVGGGQHVRWSGDGRTLFYRSPTHVIAASLAVGTDLVVARRDTLFADAWVSGGGAAEGWSVFPNGREFIFLRGPREARPFLTLVVNWRRLLEGARTTEER